MKILSVSERLNEISEEWNGWGADNAEELCRKVTIIVSAFSFLRSSNSHQPKEASHLRCTRTKQTVNDLSGSFGIRMKWMTEISLRSIQRIRNVIWFSRAQSHTYRRKHISHAPYAWRKTVIRRQWSLLAPFYFCVAQWLRQPFLHVIEKVMIKGSQVKLCAFTRDSIQCGYSRSVFG